MQAGRLGGKLTVLDLGSRLSGQRRKLEVLTHRELRPRLPRKGTFSGTVESQYQEFELGMMQVFSKAIQTRIEGPAPLVDLSGDVVAGVG